MAAIPSPLLNVEILSSLGLICAASSLMFWVLARRCTSRRQWVALSDWGRDSGFRFRNCINGPPEPLDALQNCHPVGLICLTRGKTTLVQLQTDPPSHGAGEAFDAIPSTAAEPAGHRTHWPGT